MRVDRARASALHDFHSGPIVRQTGAVIEQNKSNGANVPTELAADFAPLENPSAPDAGNHYVHDSLEAQRVYDIAVVAMHQGAEEEAVRQFLFASKLAEQSREWYLSALCCERVGDFLQTPAEPFD